MHLGERRKLHQQFRAFEQFCGFLKYFADSLRMCQVYLYRSIYLFRGNVLVWLKKK